MVHVIRIGKAGIVRIISSALLFCSFSFTLLGQSPTCTVTNTTPTVHSEGLAEQVGDISFNCSGGVGPVSSLIVISLNTNITNRLDANGNLTNITLTGATVPVDQPPI